MKITFIIPPLNLAGGTRIIVNHALHLKNRGHEVVLISPPPRKVSNSWKQKLGTLFSRKPLSDNNAIPPSYLDGLDLDHRVLETYRPISNADVPNADVVIATWWETAEWVKKFSSAKGAKVHFIQDHEVFDYLPVERIKLIYNNNFHKIVVSQWLKDIMSKEYGATDNDLVANTIDFNQFKLSDRKKNHQPTFGFLYTQTPRKAVHIAISALIKAREECPNLNVVCFGAREPDRNLPIPPWFKFHLRPPQDKIPDIFGSCDAWLFTSYSEGFGLPILEAMACGTPVIGTSAGAGPQYIHDHTGALVEATPEAFTEQIIKFAEMGNEEWLQKSTNAHQCVSGYTWHNASVLFEEALNNAILKSAQR